MIMVINKSISAVLATSVVVISLVIPMMLNTNLYALQVYGLAVAAPPPASLSTPLGQAVCSKDKNGNEVKNPDGSCKIPTDCEVEKGTDLNSGNCQILNRILQATNALSGIVAIVIVMMIVIGGIQYSSAGGDAQKVAGAKKRIYNAIFAFIAYIFMFSFLQWIVPGGVLHK